MTLPKPCPKPDCRAPITHYHGASSGDLYACTATLNGRPCPHGQDDPCYAPRETPTERIRAALNDSPESRITLDVADVEALLDMVGEGK